MKNPAAYARTIILHPFMFALQPVIFLYSVNYNEIYVNDLISTVLATALTAAVAFMLLRVLVKNSAKAGILLSFILICAFPLGQVLTQISKRSPDGMQFFFANARIFAAAALAAAFVFFYLIVKSRSDFRRATSILNVMAAVFLLMPCHTAVRSALYRGKLNYYKFPSARSAPAKDGRMPQPAAGTPDIYYIIFDRYSRSDIQKAFFGHDNSDFDEFLKGKGFFVADGSFSNYYGTHVSLSSSLNYRYHERRCADKTSFCAVDLTHHFYEIETNAAARFLKSRGYKYYHLGSFYEGTAHSRAADVNINTWLFQRVNPLTIMLVKSSSPFLLYYRYVADGKTLLRQNNDYRIRKISEELPREKTHKFVFAHFLLPHSPYIYKGDGSPLAPGEDAKTPEAALYSEQLIYTNSVIKKLVNSIQKNTANPAVIILQADEGAVSINESASGRKFSEDEIMRIRFGILNAIYLPDVDAPARDKLLRREMTPVNTFRIIFNTYFGAHYKLLPDLHFAPNGGKPIDVAFKDVTEKLKERRKRK